MTLLKALRHQGQTPTFGLTVAGIAALAAYVNGVKQADLVAFACFALVGFGGVSMALGAEVERRGEEWGWRGLARSLRSPSRVFWVHMLAHLPEMLAATVIAWRWRRRR